MATSTVLAIVVFLGISLVSVTQAKFISSGTEWKYVDYGIDMGSAWKSDAYTDVNWKVGRTDFGFESGTRTIVTKGYLTYYFRKAFTVNSVPSRLEMNLRRDDGAVVYINGREVHRTNMPNGPVDYNTLAASPVGGDDEKKFYNVSLPPNLVRQGSNVMAVEIHQHSLTSSDIHFDVELTDGSTTAPPLPPNPEPNGDLQNYLRGLNEYDERKSLDKNIAISFKGYSISYNVKGGVIKKPSVRPSFADVITSPKNGEVQLVSIGTSDGGSRTELIDEPVNERLMTLQGFTLFRAEGVKDARCELWGRRFDSSRHSSTVYISGDSNAVAWMVYTIPLSSSDFSSLQRNVQSSSRGLKVNDGNTLTIPLRPSGDLKFVSMFFDDTTDVTDNDRHLVSFSGQGDGDTYVTGLWGSASVPTNIDVFPREDRGFDAATITTFI